MKSYSYISKGDFRFQITIHNMADSQQSYFKQSTSFLLKAAIINMHSLKHTETKPRSRQRAKILTAKSASIFKPVSQKETHI